MSTLKTINIIHPTGTITNIVNDANGNVGIGTSTPALSSITNRTYLTIKGQGSLFNDGIGVLQLATNTAGSIATNLGNIEWHIPDNSSSSSTRVGFIAGYATGSTANNRGGWIDFATKPDGVSGAGSVFMSVNSSQQIGISTGGYGGAIATNFRLEIVGMAGSNTGPAATGTTQDTSAVVRIRPGGGFTAALDIGSGGGTGAWIQSTDTANLATNYALLLNPNGGTVGIGFSSGVGTYGQLEVGGSTNPTMALRSSSGSGTVFAITAVGATEARINAVTNVPLTLFTNNSERMRIDSSGNVGIGTTTPAVKLDVSGSVNISGRLLVYSQNSTNLTGLATNAMVLGTVAKNVAPSGSQGVILINSDDPSASALQGTISLITDPTAANRRLAFSVIEQGVAYRNITFAEGGGNVGIGTSSPSSKLHVAGGSGSTIRNTASAGSSWFVGSNVDSYILHNESNTPMVFTTNGVERLRIDSSGNVGIGITSTSSSLHIYRNSTSQTALNVEAGPSASYAPGIYLTDNRSAGSNQRQYQISVGGYAQAFYVTDTTVSAVRLLIDSSGNVGIGVTSPAAKLDVAGTIYSRPGNTVGAIAILTADATSGASGISLSASFASGGYGPLKFLTSNTEAMRISTNGNVGIGTSSPSADTTYKWLNIVGPTTSGGGIVQLNNSDVSVGINMFCNNLAGYFGTSTAHPLLFRINSSEVARIDASGRVGIGTNSPNSKLQVYNPSYSAFTGSSLGGILITDTNATINYYSSIDFNTTTTAALPLARIAMKYTSAGSYLVFGTSNNYANGITNTAMNIDYAGNVGIGTTSPIRTLNVNGSVASSVGNVEMSLTAAATTGTAFINVSDNVGSNGSGWSLEIRGLATSGSASTNLAAVSVSATNTYFNGNVNPGTTNSYDLGSSSYRWRNIYTQDLHLSNGIGDYTVVEGEEDLFLVNNKSGKTFKFALIEVDPSTIPPKSET